MSEWQCHLLKCPGQLKISLHLQCNRLKWSSMTLNVKWHLFIRLLRTKIRTDLVNSTTSSPWSGPPIFSAILETTVRLCVLCAKFTFFHEFIFHMSLQVESLIICSTHTLHFKSSPTALVGKMAQMHITALRCTPGSTLHGRLWLPVIYPTCLGSISPEIASRWKSRQTTSKSLVVNYLDRVWPQIQGLPHW